MRIRDLLERGRLERRAGSEVLCCGIVGYCGSDDATKVLIDGIELLQNRGYDSCGLTTMGRNKGGHTLMTTKFASKGSTSDCVDLIKTSTGKHSGHTMGIAHTRWATHGGKTDANAHPHQDYKNRISLVHNGTIDNFEELKEELTKLGIPFRSQTDTEVIANLVGHYLDKGKCFRDAVTQTVSRLRGTWGLLVMYKDDPDGFMCARNGSPIILGATPGVNEVYVASEPLALARYTNEYLALNDGDICYVSKKAGIAHLEVGRDKRAIHQSQSDISLQPTPFQHWTMKEIYEQPHALARALSFGGRIASVQGRRIVRLGGLQDNAQTLLKIKNLLITGAGTSLHAGYYGQHLFRQLEAFNSVDVRDASELDTTSFCKPVSECGVLALTQSGETRDVVEALEKAEVLGIPRFSVVNVVGSLIARMTNCGVYLHAGREVAVASTKAFTSQVVALGLIGVWFAQQKNPRGPCPAADNLLDALTKMPSVTSQLLALDSQCQQIAKKLYKARSIFVLGKGWAFPVAQEAALKIKEISYVHAEGYAGGQLKHGPFAMLDEKERTPVIMLILNDANLTGMITAAQQVKARGAELVCVTDAPDLVKSVANEIIPIPSNGWLTALGGIIPLQMLAYHMAVAKGINPDKPRGLAKTVTVN